LGSRIPLKLFIEFAYRRQPCASRADLGSTALLAEVDENFKFMNERFELFYESQSVPESGFAIEKHLGQLAMRHMKADKYVPEGLQAIWAIFMDSEQLKFPGLISLEENLQLLQDQLLRSTILFTSR
jgi:hypothetical protein